jgi:hypothetical protein
VTTTETAQSVTTTAAAAQEKATLEWRVVELEQDLVHARVNLKTANNQAADLGAKLEGATDVGSRL